MQIGTFQSALEVPKDKRRYIGRATGTQGQSPLANPYSVAFGREACIKYFKQYANMIAIDGNSPSLAIQRLGVYTVPGFTPPSRAQFMTELEALDDDSFLICYCYKKEPLTWQGVYSLICHGEVVAGLYEFLKLGGQGLSE